MDPESEVLNTRANKDQDQDFRLQDQDQCSKTESQDIPRLSLEWVTTSPDPELLSVTPATSRQGGRLKSNSLPYQKPMKAE